MKALTLSALALSLTLSLAACSTSPQLPVTQPGQSADTPTDAPVVSLASRLHVQTLEQAAVSALPKLSTLRREAGDTSERQVVVGYQDDAQLQRLVSHLGATLGGKIPELHSALLILPDTLSGEKTVQAFQHAAGGVRFITTNGQKATLGDVPASSPVTSAAPPAGLLGQAQTGHDPLFPKQWWLRQVGADQVRNVATGQGIVVGVVDTDFDRLHEDLKSDGKIVPGIDTTAPWMSLVIQPDMPLLSGSHGSGSAGTIAGRVNGVQLLYLLSSFISISTKLLCCRMRD